MVTQPDSYKVRCRDAAFLSYVLQSQCEWIHIVLTTGSVGTGSIHVSGGYGSYGYDWTATARNDFRQFLIELQPAYLFSKLSSIRIYDGAATYAAVVEALQEHKAPGEIQALHEEYNDLEEEEDFFQWYEEYDSCLEDQTDYQRTQPEPQCWVFCSEIFPVFQQHLKAELAAGKPWIGKQF
jgi:hypothetical protein